MAKLAIMTGKLQGQKMALPEKEIFIGRDDGCEIRLTGTEISRRHCRLKVESGRITAMDLGSRNGSYVNDVLISEETELHHGDLLRVGTMIFKVDQPPAKVEAPLVVSKPEPVRTEVAAKAPAKAKTPDYSGMVDVHSPSEDSIVNWLVDDAPEGGTGDSTIVARTSDTASAMKAAAPPVAAAPAVKPPPKKQFDSVKEEAADIIKRHLESVATSR